MDQSIEPTVSQEVSFDRKSAPSPPGKNWLASPIDIKAENPLTDGRSKIFPFIHQKS